jgi:hypothetical protein
MPEFTGDDRRILYDLHRTVNNGLKESAVDTRQMVRANTEAIGRIEEGVHELDRKLEIFVQTRELTCPWSAKRKNDRKVLIGVFVGPVLTGALITIGQWLLGG